MQKKWRITIPKDFFKDRTNRIGIFVFMATMLVICIPLLNGHLPDGHDRGYHMLRLESIRAGLLSGQFPVRVNPIFFNNYGYASSIFYPDLFLYIPAFLSAAGLDIELSYKAFILLISMACFITTYYSGKGISKSRFAGVTIAVIVCLSQYFLQNIYVRFALGETQAFVFYPLVIYGLYNFLYEDFDKPWLFVVGFSGLIFSHLISLLMCGVLCVVLSLFRLKHIVTTPKKIVKLLAAVALTLGITSIFWIPMLEQTRALSIQFQTSWPLGEAAVSVPVIFSSIKDISGSTCAFDTAILLMCLMRIFIVKEPGISTDVKKINWSMITGFVLIFAASILFPWRYMPSFFDKIQFPWRFFALATVFLAISIGIMSNLFLKGRMRYFGLLLIMILMGSNAIQLTTELVEYMDIAPDFYQRTANTYPANGYEYLPDGLNRDPIISLTEGERSIVMSDGTEIPFTQKGVKITFDYPAGIQSDYLDVPLLYYKGYQAVFASESGEKAELDISKQNAMIRVDSHKLNQKGQIVVDYKGTMLQRIAELITLLTVALIVILYWQKKRKLKTNASIRA